MVQDDSEPELVDPADRDAVEHVLPPDADVDAILSDVQQALRGLVDAEITVDDPADLERARQRLPTEEHRALLVSAALPFPLNEELEYVRASERQAAYWRRSRERRDPEALSDAELRHRLAFTESRLVHREETGTVSTPDGRRISRSAAETGAELRGESFDEDDGQTPTEERRGESLFSRIRDRLLD